MKGKGRKLHETPPEFQKAREARAARLAWEQRACGCHIRKLEEEARREALRNMKMPAHLPPRRRCVGWGMGQPEFYESDAAYRRRYGKWAIRFLKNGAHSSSTE